jgi:cyclopropane fatty-acyl-phospholipid synthase-like methyltransferase
MMYSRPVCLSVYAVALLLVPLSLSAAAQQKPETAKPDHMHHRFDDAERWAKSFDDPARDAWQMPDRVVAALNLQPGQSVADIGAGTGYFSVRLARSQPAATIYAVDIEPSMVAHLAKRAAAEHLKNIVAVQAGSDRANLPQPVDVALFVDVYHHLPNRPAYFRELKKSLKPAARVAIVDFRKDSPDGPPVEFRFTAEQIEREMREAGFQLETAHTFLPRQHFLVFRVE